MTDVWESGWEVINEAFRDIAEELRHRNPKLWWTCGHSENEAFPFWAYASFSRSGVAGEEDVVVSVSFKRDGGALEFTSDVARGDGEILVDGPRDRIELATDTGAIRAWIESCFDQASVFVNDQRPVLQSELL